MRDLLFLPFEGAPRGPLTTEVQRAQEMPDRPGMIGHTGQILNQQRHPRQRPKRGPITPGHRPLQQSRDDRFLNEFGIAHEAEEYNGSWGEGNWGVDGRIYMEVLPFFVRHLDFGGVKN